jgi:hypothetical protein
MSDVNYYRSLAGLPAVKNLTEAVMHQDKAKKKKVKKANLTEKDHADKKAKKAMFKAACKVASGNRKATDAGKMKKHVKEAALAHFGDKKIASAVTEAVLWKKLATVKPIVTEQELSAYFQEFDTLLEKVVDTNMGAKSLHKQYDPTIDGNVYKDSKTEADKAGKGAAYKKDDKWHNYNQKARDKGIEDTQDPKGGEPGDRSPVAGQDASFVDGNVNPSTKVSEDASGAKHAIEAMGKAGASEKAKEAVRKGQAGYGNTKEGAELLTNFRKIAGMDAETDDQTLFVVTEAATGKIECMFPSYQDASKWLDKMKKAAGTYNIDPKTFSRGFHFKTENGDGFTTDKK